MIGLIIAFAVGLVLSISLTPLLGAQPLRTVHSSRWPDVAYDEARHPNNGRRRHHFCHCRCMVYRNPD